MAAAGTHQIGSIVQVRGRDWVVTSNDGEILRLKPLSGGEEEAGAVHLGIEGSLVKEANFPPPSADHSSDLIAGKLLRDAARLALRSGAGPFRSMGRLSVRPRPYQFVPLIMALKLDPARLLIADDVGIGKTIEAGLIAAELLSRGDAKRICVLCPPHLCDQWEEELREKFHIYAEVVRSSTIARLDRTTPHGQSLYEYFPHLIISIDFAKSDRHKPLLLQHCPDLVIVDEAHAASDPGYRGSADQQQRHALLREIAGDSTKHLLLLTATPHSGVEASFQSLLGLLDPKFLGFNLQDPAEAQRRELAEHIVQRRRGDIDEKWLGAGDESRPFPKRVPPFEDTYRLSSEYGALFNDVLAFTRQTVKATGLSETRQRARYWAALTLLRCLMSSPAAAQQAFYSRQDALKSSDESEVEEEVRVRETMDPLFEYEVIDAVPEAGTDLAKADLSQTDRSKLRDFLQRAEALVASGKDPKIEKAAEIITDWVKMGHRPIVFCRFIPTAKYVAEQLQERIRTRYTTFRATAVSGDTGGDEERRATIEALVDPDKGGTEKRVLVATDCLSEGINLQEHFDAVLHYDLPWNPNRLEQREGRVDRFGQQKAEVRALVLFSEDNPMDGIVLNVLIRKARQIYKDLGISVPVPSDSESVMKAVVKAVFEGWRGEDSQQLRLNLPELDTVKVLHGNWERNAEREKERHTRFAQHRISPDEVTKEIEATDAVLGDPEAVRHFMLNATQRLKFSMHRRDGYYELDPVGLPADIRDRLGWRKPVKAVFVSPPPKNIEGAVVLGRNHPLVAFLSDRILGKAFLPPKSLLPKDDPDYCRSGAAYTSAVKVRTVIALLRVRYQLQRRNQSEQFAEEVITVGGRAEGGGLAWSEPNDPGALAVLESAQAVGNISPQEKQQRISRALEELKSSSARLKSIAEARAAGLEETYDRLKGTLGGGKVKVKLSQHSPDVLGIYVLLPGGKA